MKQYFSLLAMMLCGVFYAQSTITGKVVDDFGQGIPGANVVIVGESIGTVTGADGTYSLSTQKNPPFKLEFSMLGFESQQLEVKTKAQKVNVTLKEEQTQLSEIVVSASRTPERILESPVTIERMGIKEVKNTASPSFYDGLENLKEVHFNTSSLNFKSINTRGFATVANTRFMQLVDGMDNSSPALNFVLGNLIGLSDLDVASVELLPGASSALYGANAFNGILFMNSKSPFTHQGISFYTKNGITSQRVAGQNSYWDVGIRAAHKFTNHFAAKANFTYLRATEWIAADDRSLTAGGIGHGVNQNYDGLNNYGDEVSTNLRGVGVGLANAGLIPSSAVNLLPNENVSRTGYREQDLSDNQLENVKVDVSLHFKPFEDDFEIIAQHKIGTGNTIYQGANRYRLENFTMQQSKLEVKGKNFFARGYVTWENAGDSYDMRFAAWNINRQWKDDATWFGQYAGAYIQASGLNPLASQQDLHAVARAVADQGRFLPGTPEFVQALEVVRANPDLTSGAKFIDRSRYWHSDMNYNLKDMIKFAEIQVGGSFRRYIMNSEGTIFTDFDGPLSYDEYGAYTQIQKKFLDDRLKFTGSIRYDKSQNFDGQFSPRVSFVYSAGERKNHNFRASFQTGFRNPTTQDQYIGLNLGPFALIGSAPDNLGRFVETLPVSQAGIADGNQATVTFNGFNAYNDSFTIPSVMAALAANDASLLERAEISLVKPEQVKAFEAGYKSVLENGLSIDLNGYYNIYNDFMSTARVMTPYYNGTANGQTALDAFQRNDRRVYQIYTNTSAEITSFGFGLGLAKKVYKDFELGASYNHAQFTFDQSQDPTFIAGFNTPRHRAKASLSNDKLFKNFGFNIQARWWSEYEWQSSFADGTIPSTAVLDAQINYAVPSIKSVFKVSAANIGNNDYLQVIGAGRIGQQYLISWTINP